MAFDHSQKSRSPRLPPESHHERRPRGKRARLKRTQPAGTRGGGSGAGRGDATRARGRSHPGARPWRLLLLSVLLLVPLLLPPSSQLAGAAALPTRVPEKVRGGSKDEHRTPANAKDSASAAAAGAPTPFPRGKPPPPPLL